VKDDEDGAENQGRGQLPRLQFLQQWTPWCPEQVPAPVEQENVLSPQTACGSPTLLPAQRQWTVGALGTRGDCLNSSMATCLSTWAIPTPSRRSCRHTLRGP